MNELALPQSIFEPGAVAHLDQYFGPWAMLEERFAGLQSRIALAATARAAANDSGKPYAINAGLAILALRGPMTKYGSLGSSTIGMKLTLRQAVADPAVDAILLVIDSPGGSVDGTADLALEVARINAFKPVVAFLEDTAASAAYWVASQAGRVIGNSTGVFGGIGVYAVIEDWSKAAADAGVKVHVIRAGEFKGAGTTGTEVTDKQLNDFQRIIDATNELFIAAVAKGRGLTSKQAAKLNDGRVYVGAEAVALGLVDKIGTFDDAQNMARQQIELRALAA